MSAWTDHVARWKDCTACALCNQRSNIVLARGKVPCDLLFVGEAPGQSEDALGQPFVGPAGQLLDQIIANAVPPDIRFALTNLVACFPAEAKARGDNEPELSEIQACRPRLRDFIGLAKPRLIVCVGTLASDYIHHDAGGQVMGAEVVTITHPASILRMPLAQKQMAVQRSIVTVRNAVQDYLLQS